MNYDYFFFCNAGCLYHYKTPKKSIVRKYSAGTVHRAQCTCPEMQLDITFTVRIRSEQTEQIISSVKTKKLWSFAEVGNCAQGSTVNEGRVL
jgi:hypothetical protein